METSIKIAAIFIFFSFVVIPVHCKHTATPLYDIDLDKPPTERWSNVAKDYAFMIPAFREVIEDVIPPKVLTIIEFVASNLTYYVPQPYADELTGYGEAIGIPTVDIILVNLYYELTAHCTSFVVEDANHTIWHGRNLDYNFMSLLDKCVIDVNFISHNKTQYRGTTFAGYLGLITGQKDGMFTVSMNQRNKGTSKWMNLVTALLEKKTYGIGFLVRDTLSEAVSFTDATVRLTTHYVIAPTYIIVGGVQPGEGVVITRDRLSSADNWYLNAKKDRWYVLETNYDHWLPAPKHDDRRDHAMRVLNDTTPAGINKQSVFGVLTHKGVFTNHTVYSVVMSASQPLIYTSWIWK